MGELERSRHLTQDELAAVLRRAAELDAEDGLVLPTEGIAPEVVEAAAIEAGFSPHAVRRALDEVLHPDVRPPDVYAGGRLPSRELVVEREVPVSVEEAEAWVGRFLRRQNFQQARVFADGSRWVPRQGVAATIVRSTDLAGRLRLKQVKEVSVTVSSLGSGAGGDPPATLVRVALDLRGVRSIHATWLGAGVAVGGAAVVGSAAWLGVDPLVLLSLPVAGGTTYGGHLIGRHEARSEVDRIHTAVAGMLDELEHGERAQRSRGRRSRSTPRRRSTSGARHAPGRHTSTDPDDRGEDDDGTSW